MSRACAALRLAAAGLLLLVVGSTSAWAEDLLEVYQAARHNDAAFAQARHAFLAAAQAIPTARAGLLPSISLQGNDGLTRASTSFADLPQVDRRIRTWTWTLELDQPLFDLGKFYAYRQSRFAVEEARARFDQASSALILKVARAYFGVVAAQEALAAARARVMATRSQLAQAKQGFRSGIAAVTDVYEARARLELARSREVAAAGDLDNKRAQLQRITDEWPGKLATLRPEAVIPKPAPDDPRAWMDAARQRNPQVRAHQAALAQARAAIRRSRAGFLPTIDLTASYGDNYASDNLTSPQDYSTRYASAALGLKVVVPLYSGGATDSDVAAALAKRDEAADALRRARRHAATEARSALIGIRDGIMRIRALDASLRAGRAAVKGDEVGYRLGLRINTDVLGAQQQVYRARRDLARARYETLLQGLKLKAAVGSLSEADLATLNALLSQPASRPADRRTRPGSALLRRGSVFNE